MTRRDSIGYRFSHLFRCLPGSDVPMTMPVRRTFRLCLWSAATLLAGCAHQQPFRNSNPVVIAAPPASATAPTPEVITPIAVPPDTGSAASDASQPPSAATAVVMTPAAPAVITQPVGDLFARIRGGFSLPDSEQRTIDVQLNWYANNPEYLERVFGRAELYMHYIVEQLEKRKMPRELALLPVVESAFEPYAYSRARASGLWQFIPGTGTNYGLRQNWWYDGRRDVVESTRAALDYLQALHDEFDGDWLLAIAGYNCGEGAVARAVRRNRNAGLPADFWHLKLPTETRAYVPKLLAMSRLVANPGDYGLEFSRIPDEAYFAPVKTGGQIDMQVVADLAGISKEEMYELNPAFHRWATDPVGPYQLLVPIEVAGSLEQTLLSLSPEQRMRVERYTVQRGDSVSSVAKAYTTTANELRELNGLANTDRLVVGSELRVPSSSVALPEKAARAAALVDRRGSSGTSARRGARGGVHVVRRGDTLSSIARRLGTDTRTLARLNNMDISDTIRAGQRLVVATRGRSSSAASAPAVKGDGKRVTYTVRRGDTLYSIARVLQVTVGELLGWNGMSKSSIIKPGQHLVAFVNTRG
jgi:membrane-bound lytic murein transglycosylase D